MPTHTTENGKKKALSKAQQLQAVKEHIKKNYRHQDHEEPQENEEQAQQQELHEEQQADEDEELTAQEYTASTWTTPDGITYDLEHAELYDQESGEKVGDLSDSDPKGWVIRKEAVMIHATNIGKLMAEKMADTL